MNLFAKLQTNAAQVKTTDVDFAGKFTVDTDAYPATLRIAYLDQSKSGAIWVNLEAILNKDGKERTYKETIYISNREGSLTYKCKKTGEDKPLPGYVTIDTLCKAATGKSFAEMATEVKKIKVRNHQTRQDELVDKEILMDLLNTKVILGIQEVLEDKYNAPGETVTRNNLNKVFTGEGKTLNEHEANAEAKYITEWVNQNKGKVLNKTTGATGGAPQAGKPATPNAGQPAPSLFG